MQITIETKFAPGDVFYYVEKGDIRYYVVSQVQFSGHREDSSEEYEDNIKYSLKSVSDMYKNSVFTASQLQQELCNHHLFTSKKELIKHLMEQI